MQDDWKVTSNLTLNLGLRYEYNGQLYEDRDRLTNFARSTMWWFDRCAGFQRSRVKGSSIRTMLCFTAKKDFGSRFGFAYNPSGSDKTVIRGGYGIFFVNAPFNRRQGIAFNFPWIERQIVTNTRSRAILRSGEHLPAKRCHQRHSGFPHRPRLL